MTDRLLRVGAVAMLLLTAAATRTGGWAVITVSDLPESLTAETPVRIEYVVRQHGADAQLLPGLTGSVTASTSAGQHVTGSVTGGTNGRYVATFTLPAAGAWTIRIGSGFAAAATTLDPIAVVAAGAPAPAAALPAERGRHLFVAKGCVACHVNREIAGSGVIAIGPELVRGRLAPDYVARVLADPTKAVITQSSFRMPQLNLKPAEITALVALLTGSDRQVAAGQ